MTALICGSVAYDTVMVFEGHFKDHILADRIHMLNVAFLVPGLRRNFGGCAGNIGYNLKLLGGQGKVMATVGMDFGPYRAWMIDCGLSLDHIRQLDDEYTAQAYITTDADNNQITAFHPGAMNHAHVNKVPKDAGINSVSWLPRATSACVNTLRNSLQRASLHLRSRSGDDLAWARRSARDDRPGALGGGQ